MKKTLIVLLTLGGIAMGETVNPSEVVLTLPNSGSLTHDSYFGGANSNTDGVFNHVKNKAADGAYAGNNGGSGGTWVNTPGTEGYWNKETATITLAGRNGTQGESFALVLNNSIDVGQLVSSVSFSGTVVAGNVIQGKPFAFSVAIYDGSNPVYTAEKETITGLSSESVNFNVNLSIPEGYEWKDTSKIIAVLAGPAFTPVDGIYNVAGISVKATTNAPVPEPATGTLSLLALAGLCARRRKK